MLALGRIAALGAAFLFASGCASDVQVGVSYDPLTRFPAQATFAWDDRASSLPQDDRIQQLNLDPLIKRVVAEEMGARGYREATSGAANYLLSYQVGVNTWHGAQGSLSIGSWSLLMVEAASKRRIWLGFARAEVEVGLSEAEREQRFRKTTRRLLEDFPPSQRGN